MDAKWRITKVQRLSDVSMGVDRISSAGNPIENLNYNGKYGDGFECAMISKKNVTQTTNGYNYFYIGNDLSLYRCVTSANGDE